jgi:UDP-hydrolysing UDP-N-acetyl-D-glucosamine 2-epimerase
MHLSHQFGYTVTEIEADGFFVDERVEMLLASDSPAGIASSIGLGVLGFARVFGRRRPDLLLILGDRFEMFAAATAALPFALPIAHLHGGESTEGSIDEAIRHSLTKMSHLHFVSTDRYRARVLQLGEEPWRIIVSGAPALDNLATLSRLTPEALEARIGMTLKPAPLLVTFHPVTLECDEIPRQIGELMAALEDCGRPIVFTQPNADTHGRVIIDAIREYTKSHANAAAVMNLGTDSYFSLMAYAAAMVGNSSSGIVEAASFGLPVVNIGNRQRGRLHAHNVVNVDCNRAAIADAIRLVLSRGFRADARRVTNPYWAGGAAELIVDRLKTAALDERLLLKRFHDVATRQV